MLRAVKKKFQQIPKRLFFPCPEIIFSFLFYILPEGLNQQNYGPEPIFMIKLLQTFLKIIFKRLSFIVEISHFKELLHLSLSFE